MNLSSVWRNVRNTLVEHSPEILVGIGIAGMVTSTVLAVRATPKAMELIEDMKVEKNVDELTPVETIEAAWKCYIPAAVTGVLSTACLVGASSVNLKRNAALATAYTLSETALREYKDKVIETVGEKKAEAIQNSVNQDKLDKNPIDSHEIVITERGGTLFYDPISGRYFKSDIEQVKKAVNEVNRTMVGEGYISLNELYEALGLDSIRIGDDIGWRVDRSLIDLKLGAQIATDGTPCIVLDYFVAPRYDFNM